MHSVQSTEEFSCFSSTQLNSLTVWGQKFFRKKSPIFLDFAGKNWFFVLFIEIFWVCLDRNFDQNWDDLSIFRNVIDFQLTHFIFYKFTDVYETRLVNLSVTWLEKCLIFEGKLLKKVGEMLDIKLKKTLFVESIFEKQQILVLRRSKKA